MSAKERKEGIAKIKKRLSSEGLYDLHDQVGELFENFEMVVNIQAESDERIQKLIAKKESQDESLKSKNEKLIDQDKKLEQITQL